MGFTSHDCVAKLRKLLNTRKIGHGGTLDPAAQGVLPIAVGKATRLLQFLPTSKAYRARIRLGMATATDDLEGEVISQADTSHLSEGQIITCLKHFVGTIDQIPPIYSAIKKDGRKLYELARQGKSVILEQRKVRIDSIKLLNLTRSQFVELEVEISCGPGTYIRAIARDLGKRLGVGGTLAGLVRTQSCGLHLQQSLSFEEIQSRIDCDSLELIEPSLLLDHLTSVTLDPDYARRWCHGQLVDLSQSLTLSKEITVFKAEHYLATYRSDRTFLGISVLYEREGILKLKPKLVIE